VEPVHNGTATCNSTTAPAAQQPGLNNAGKDSHNNLATDANNKTAYNNRSSLATVRTASDQQRKQPCSTTKATWPMEHNGAINNLMGNSVTQWNNNTAVQRQHNNRQPGNTTTQQQKQHNGWRNIMERNTGHSNLKQCQTTENSSRTG
jgi:hypothetical protein